MLTKKPSGKLLKKGGKDFFLVFLGPRTKLQLDMAVMYLIFHEKKNQSYYSCNFKVIYNVSFLRRTAEIS